MPEAVMTAVPKDESKQRQQAWTARFSQEMITSLTKFGIAVVLVLLYYLQIIKPDADARREAERATANAVIETTVTQRMIVDQLRRGEEADIRRDLMMRDLTTSSQKQTEILQQIMVDQKRGAWKESP